MPHGSSGGWFLKHVRAGPCRAERQPLGTPRSVNVPDTRTCQRIRSWGHLHWSPLQRPVGSAVPVELLSLGTDSCQYTQLHTQRRGSDAMAPWTGGSLLFPGSPLCCCFSHSCVKWITRSNHIPWLLQTASLTGSRFSLNISEEVSR